MIGMKNESLINSWMCKPKLFSIAFLLCFPLFSQAQTIKTDSVQMKMDSIQSILMRTLKDTTQTSTIDTTQTQPEVAEEEENDKLKGEEKEEYYLADDLIENENFKDAITLYTKLLKFFPKNPDINFKIGFCYLNSAEERNKSIEYLAKAVEYAKEKKEETYLNDYFFYLGRAYRSNYKIKEALATFKELRERLRGKENTFKVDVQHEVEYCENAIKAIDNPVNFVIKNLGPKINSKYTDHSPVIPADESFLIFTSKREGGMGEGKTADGEFFEDIYISNRVDSNWTTPVSISDKINTTRHEASIGLSVDGQQLLIYKDDYGDGNIYYSNLIGDKWTKPKKFPAPINTKARETHASLSSDGNKIYFTSDRKGGLGGMDIYVVRKLPNGEWSAAENLGPKVNTPFDEEGPYIHPDGVTLYFSSKGHNSIGGFDIFRTVLEPDSNKWSTPENIGYPINTPENDVFYIPTADGKRAYYVSQREGGSGKADIYLVSVPGAKESGITLVSGKIWICTGELPDCKITVFDDASNEVYGIYKPNSKTGKYLFVLTKGKSYRVEYEANNDIIHSEMFYVGNDAPYQEITKQITIKAGKPCDDEIIASNENIIVDLKDTIKNITVIKNPLITKGPFNENGVKFDMKIEIQNILFAFAQVGAIPTNPTLDALAEYLILNPEAIVEIGAYADAKGSDSYNINLTQNRANAAKAYLLNKKIKNEQLVAVGYGKQNPIAINKNANGSWNEEGMRFNRRVEFKLLKQGKSTLLVKPIANIPDELKIKK